jgi:hypothetical protein
MAAKPAQDTAPAGSPPALADPPGVPGDPQRPRLSKPAVVEAAGPLTDCDPDFCYRSGVDLFIRGVQAMAEQG